MVLSSWIPCPACHTRLEAVRDTEGELWLCQTCGLSETHENLVMKTRQAPPTVTVARLKPAP